MYFYQEGANVKIKVKERNFVSTPSRIVIVQNLKFPNRVKSDESNQWSYWRILIYVDKFISNIKVNSAFFFLDCLFCIFVLASDSKRLTEANCYF